MLTEEQLVSAAARAEFSAQRARTEGYHAGFDEGYETARRIVRRIDFLRYGAWWLLLGVALGMVLGYGFAQVLIAERMF